MHSVSYATAMRSRIRKKMSITFFIVEHGSLIILFYTGRQVHQHVS
jgi:hypothetical protein